jgi:3-isopropylmalate/(R)-2-methylmalate dehydratase small subunit
MKFEGRVWHFGDHVDTDLIIPARFLNRWDPDVLAEHCFADLRPEFAASVRRGDVIVAGTNFGCGSSREHGPLAIQAVGIGVVVAKSFARIFYRNACNIGLAVLVCEKAVDVFSEGETLSVDLDSGELAAGHEGKRAFAEPMPEFMRMMLLAGGLVAYTRKRDLIRSEKGMPCRRDTTSV